LNDSRSYKDSYCFWEWRLSIAQRGGLLSKGELTENGRKFLRLESNYLLCIVSGFVVLCMILGVVCGIIFDLGNFSPLFKFIGGGLGIGLIAFAFLVTNYMLHPIIGRYAYDEGYITEDELQMFLKRRIPFSIFLNSKNVPRGFWKILDFEQSDPSEPTDE
jgi:hypothetical protein